MKEYNLNLKLDYCGLVNLHKTLLEAKFHTMPDNEDVSGSPFVAGLYIQVRDLLMESDTGSQWENWFQLRNQPGRRSQAIILMKKYNSWSKATSERKREIASNYLAPFLFNEEELRNVILEVDNGV